MTKLEKLAEVFEKKLEKYAQEMTYSFDPNQDLLALKAPSNLKKAQQVAQDAVPDNFAGKVVVDLVVQKDKSFQIASNVKNVSVQLQTSFGTYIKELMDAAGPVDPKKTPVPIKWNWFSFAIE